MRRVKLFFLSFMLVCLLGAFIETPVSEAVTIHNKPLGNIPDIVKEVTRSDFPELQKHSILFYERFSRNGATCFTPKVFTLNNDGTMRKMHELADYYINHTTESATEYVVQRMSLAMSNKRFGQRRTVMTTLPGMHHPNNYEYNVWGFRTIESNGTEDSADISLINPSDEFAQFGDNRIIWGNAYMTVKGMEDKDVFVCLHSPRLSRNGNLYFRFFTSNRNETGNVERNDLSVQGGDSDGWKIWDYSDGIRGAGVAAGDFDGDGYKNEIAVCFNDDNNVFAYFFRLTFANGQGSVERLYNVTIHNAGYWSTSANKQASPNVVAGDFNGDGKDEAAFVNKTFPYGEANNQMRVTIIERDKKTGEWKVAMAGISGIHETACKAARCDFDGDGKDELAILFFEEQGDGALYPRLERWYCDRDKIQPIRDTDHIKGGARRGSSEGDKSVLGYWVAGGDYNRYYKIAEDLCITAGPVTGTKGRAKLAEDIIISHVNSDASRLFVIPTKFEGNQFAGFGDYKKIYDVVISDPSRRGAVITGDFANEVLMLGSPSHRVDDHDESYVAVLQAFPYHVDNIDINGNRTDSPINYTYSDFSGNEGNGKMNVKYSKTQDSQTEQDVSFVTTSTTETIGILGDAGPAVHGYLKFRSTEANIAGNFDPRIKAGAEIFNSIMDFITDRIDQTTTEATKQANQKQTVTTITADMWDMVHKYTAPQHIWRYKILNKPLPSWYRLGPKADDAKGNLKLDSKDYYMTFTLYDNTISTTTPSNQTNTYQPVHEEGNFFSYPSVLSFDEGYNSSGQLDTPHSITWSKGGGLSQAITFSKEKIDSLKYDENIQRSGLTKTISAIASMLGLDDPDPFPPYTSHNKSFVKNFSTSESIEFNLQGRSTQPGEYAGNKLFFVPYLANEGTMKVAMAVKLTDDGTSPLWEDSLYCQLPDPALLLPGKYIREGGRIATNNVASSAMKMRGLRFYVPELDLHSDTNFLAGLTYKVRVPLYNASFVDTGNFDVRLSYAPAGKGNNKKFDVRKPYITSELKPIQTLENVTIGGWQNGYSDNNKKWLEFTFDVPEDASTDNYVFYVQIDPEHKLQEVHESRMDSTGKLLDSGGNNEGYFSFHITSLEEAQGLANRKIKASSAAPRALSSRGTIYRAVSKNPSGNSEGEVFSSEGGLDSINIMSVFEETEGLDLLGLLAVFGEGYSNGEEDADALKADDDATYPIVMDITYNGDEYYPEAYLCGFNYKAGTLTAGVGGEVDHAFLDYKIALVPHTTTTVVINLDKQYMDYFNGTGFEIVVPELSNSGKYNPDTEPEPYPEPDPTPVNHVGSPGGGCDTGFAVSGLMILMSALIFRKK